MQAWHNFRSLQYNIVLLTYACYTLLGHIPVLARSLLDLDLSLNLHLSLLLIPRHFLPILGLRIDYN